MQQLGVFLFSVLLPLHCAFAANDLNVPASQFTTCDVDLSKSDENLISARLIGEAINTEQLKRRLSFLTGEVKLPGYFEIKQRHSESHRAIVRRLIRYFLTDEIGTGAEFETFREGANIVAEIQGTDLKHEVIEFAAHFDTAGPYVPGADDNGSGVVTLFEIASTLIKHPPRRTVRLVFLDLEESECEGSCFHAQQLKHDPRTFLGSIIVDMIAYVPPSASRKLLVAEVGPGPNDKEPEAWTKAREKLKEDAKKKSVFFRKDYDFDSADFKRLRQRNHELAQEIFYVTERLSRARGVELSAETTSSYPDSGDHGAYWTHGVPAILISTPYLGKYLNPQNHSHGDEIKNMNWDFFVEGARMMVEVAAYLSRTTATFAESERSRMLPTLENLAVTAERLRNEGLPPSIPLDPELAHPPKPKPPENPFAKAGSLGKLTPLQIPKALMEKTKAELSKKAQAVVTDKVVERYLTLLQAKPEDRLLMLGQVGDGEPVANIMTRDDPEATQSQIFAPIYIEIFEQGGGHVIHLNDDRVWSWSTKLSSRAYDYVFHPKEPLQNAATFTLKGSFDEFEAFYEWVEPPEATAEENPDPEVKP